MQPCRARADFHSGTPDAPDRTSLFRRGCMMADDRNIRGPQDRSRINTEQDYEMRYWTRELNVSEDELRRAVQSVGSSADKVREHLRQANR
jgi:hypothetical protein